MTAEGAKVVASSPWLSWKGTGSLFCTAVFYSGRSSLRSLLSLPKGQAKQEGPRQGVSPQPYRTLLGHLRIQFGHPKIMIVPGPGTQPWGHTPDLIVAFSVPITVGEGWYLRRVTPTRAGGVTVGALEVPNVLSAGLGLGAENLCSAVLRSNPYCGWRGDE